jgi:hypothetical protein
MAELLRTRHFIVESIPGTPRIEVTRTAEGFASVEEMRLAFTEVSMVLDREGRHHSALLVDTRAAPPRNDPEFEAAFDPIRVMLLTGFPKIALIVRTTAGRLQAERHSKHDNIKLSVFMDLDEARAFCAYLW